VGGTPSAEGGAKNSGGAPVRVATVTQTNMPVVEHTIGTVVANTLVQVTARIEGVVDAANFKEGQFVKKGDLLFQIDPRGFEAALEQARAALLRDEALLRNALRDKQRQETLLKRGATSAQARDTVATNAEALAATVAVDKAAVKMAELNLGYTEIRSPVEGKTGPLLVQPGNMVTGTTSTTLVTIAQVQPVKISFSLPEADLPAIQARQRDSRLTATLNLSDAAGNALVAPVDFTSNAVNNQSGTIELRATFGNGDLALVPGQLVNVTVELNVLHDALTVPRTAINDGPAGPFIYIAKDGKASSHAVKVLFDDSTNVAIASDVRPGELVIVEGQLRVESGGKVRILPGKSVRE
jgi:multidrug efflux system membrane fusion protein